MILLEKNFIKILREKGIRRADVARRLGQTRSSITKNLRGEVDPRWSTIAKLASALKIPAWRLIVDYESGEIGPLNDQEKTLVLNFRKIPSDEKKRVVEDVAQQFAEHKSLQVKD